MREKYLLKLKANLLLFFVMFATFSPAAYSDSKGGVLEIEALKLYMSSRSHAAIDIRFTNSTSDDIQHWAIDIEIYDKNEKYLSRGEGMVSHIPAGSSKIEQILLLDTNATDIGSWKATLGGVVGYSGLRVDQKYTLKMK